MLNVSAERDRGEPRGSSHGRCPGGHASRKVYEGRRSLYKAERPYREYRGVGAAARPVQSL
jgi:hypothetical protein